MSNNMVQGTGTKWLIVVLIYADFTDQATDKEGDIIVGIDSMLHDFLSTSLNIDLCRVFVLMDSISSVKKTDGTYIRNLIARYEIAKSKTNINNEIAQCIILFDSETKVDLLGGNDTSRYNRHKFQQADAVAKVLRTVPILDNEHILFITWDHGAGFGIFSDKMQLPLQIPAETLPFQEKLAKYPALKCFWERAIAVDSYQNIFCSDATNQPSQNPEILENSELASALSSWLSSYKKQYVDVLLMTNCWMMNMHTMYAMKNVVQCLVASQTPISIPAYNYASIANLINTKTLEVSPHDVARCCIESRKDVSFIQKIKGIPLPIKDVIDDCVIVALDLMAKDVNGSTFLDNQFTALRDFVHFLRDMILNNPEGDSIKHLIRYARGISYDFETENIYLIDINNFIFLIANISKNLSRKFPQLGDATEKFKAGMGPGNALISGHRILKPYPVDWDSIIPKPTGYSLFFRYESQKLVDKTVNYCVFKDPLLTSFLPEWQEVLTLVFGE